LIQSEAIGELPGTEGTKTFPLDAPAMTQYALGSTKLIASLLIIPDAIALLPNTISVVGWVLKLIGLWLSAAVLWFVSFCAILQFVRFLAVGVRVDSQGVKTWRFARLLTWDKIEALAIEDRKAFSKMFSLKKTARRLTLYVSKGSKPILQPNYLPSFLFSAEVFDELVRTICQHKFAQTPDASNYFMVTPAGLSKLKKTQRAMTTQTILVSLIVAVGLVVFLGKKAAVHFTYNSGNKAIVRGNYQEAARRYLFATRLDPSFAFAWNSAAQAELFLNKFDAAKLHFQKAIESKPDFVEAELGLARLDLDQFEFGEARKNIDAALKVVPSDELARALLAYCQVKYGQTEQGLAVAYKVPHELRANANPVQLNLSLAEGTAMLNTDRADEALAWFNQINPSKADKLYRKTFLLTEMECAIAAKTYDQAEDLLNKAGREYPHDTGVINGFITLALAREDLEDARERLVKLSKKYRSDIRVQYNQALYDYQASNTNLAKIELQNLVRQPDLNVQMLLGAANMLIKLKAPELAQEAASRVLSINKENAEALKIMLRP